MHKYICKYIYFYPPWNYFQAVSSWNYCSCSFLSIAILNYHYYFLILSFRPAYDLAIRHSHVYTVIRDLLIHRKVKFDIYRFEHSSSNVERVKWRLTSNAFINVLWHCKSGRILIAFLHSLTTDAIIIS